MNFDFRTYPPGLLCFAVFAWAAIPAFSQSPPAPKLVLNQPIESEIKGGESQFYTVSLGANQTARVEVVQKGIEISLAAYQPGGERFIEAESPSGSFGNDSILVTAIEAGEYKISAEGADPRAGPGKYQIKLAEIRPTVEEDNRINERAKQMTALANATNPMRQLGTQAGRRQAIENFRQIAELARLQKDTIWEIVALVQMGIIYEQLGELQKSIDAHETGLRLAREVGNRQWEGGALNNLGLGYKALGDCEKAVSYLNQSLQIDRELRDQRGEGFTSNNLGGCYLMLDDAAKAREFFERALALHRAVKNQRSEANALNNLGQLFVRIGDRARAVEFFEQALAVRRAVGDKAGEAVPLQNLGRIFLTAGETAEATEYFEQSNRLARQVGDRRVEAQSFYWLALAERAKGNLPKAIENVENGLALIEQIRGELISPDLRVVFFSTVQQFYELYTELIVARSEKSKDGADVALALEISERARTRSLVELLQEARIDFKQGVDRKSVEQAQDLQSRINAKYRQRTVALAGRPAPEQIAKITDEINSLTAELENLQVKIRRENPRYASLTSGGSPSAKEIQKLLDDETVLLEYKLGDAKSFLWLVTAGAVKIYALPPREEIEKTAKDFYSAIVARERSKDARTADLQRRLSEILLAPVVSEIENKRLAIVADGVLQFTPFAALQVQNFLIEANEIIVLPSAGVLAELRRNSVRAKTPGKTLAVFADPIFEADDPRLAKEPVKPAAKPADLNRVLRDFNRGETLPRLLSSREEARNIAAFAAKNQAVANVDFEASRENAMSENMANYRVLHFATHGLLDAAHPEFSGLVFSLYDRNGKARDGFLRLNQIYNLNLNSDLVVLSACQTALGKDVRGEGLIGLTRGFMYAGAKRVVASLWKVDDAATAEFMRRFYQNFLQKKHSPAAALKHAQNEMRQIPRFRRAYFWAGFTLQGDWKENEK